LLGIHLCCLALLTALLFIAGPRESLVKNLLHFGNVFTDVVVAVAELLEAAAEGLFACR
jgi:hypothetical protein